MKKANLILGAVLMMAVKSHADLVYTDADMTITLLDDVCSPSQPHIRLAYAEDTAHTDKANGCWWSGKMGTYVIELERGDGTQESYQLYREKFREVSK